MKNNLNEGEICIEELNVSTEQLSELVQLTNPTLGNLNCKFIIVRNITEFAKTDFYQSLNEDSKQKLGGFMSNFSSFYISTHDLIIMLLDDIEGQSKRDKAIQFTSILFHEIRHAWQSENSIFDMSNPLQIKSEDYGNQPHEIDAVMYSDWAINHYKNQIANIFNIDSDWTFKSTIN